MAETRLTDTTDEVERLLFGVVKPLYARDIGVPGLLDLPLAQLRALNVLGRDPARTPTMGELADALGVALSTATQLVERIEKRGLARREHSDPDDRRVVRLALTEAGHHLLAERRRLRRERLAAALGRLSPGQQEALLDALAALAAATQRVDEESARSEAPLAPVFGEAREELSYAFDQP